MEKIIFIVYLFLKNVLEQTSYSKNPLTFITHYFFKNITYRQLGIVPHTSSFRTISELSRYVSTHIYELHKVSL